MTGPLSGIKILDFTRLLPGPLCTHLLTRLGANIIKIESNDNNDYVRYLPPYININNKYKHSSIYESLNCNKKNIIINLKNQNSQNIIKKLVKSYDVIVEGNRPGVMKRLGIDYDELKKENPRLIYCSITGYGSTGSYSKRAGHDINYMALAGMIGLSGKSGTVPPLPGFQGADASGAMQAVIGIQSAIIERFTTNVGQFVDVSLTEAAMALAVPSLAAQIASKDMERGTSLLDGGIINYNIYETKDQKYITVGALEDHFWNKFCTHLNLPHLIIGTNNPNDKSAAPNTSQSTLSLSEKQTEVINLFKSKTLSEWLEISSQIDACIEPVLTPNELVNHPLHVSRQNILINKDDPKLKQFVFGPKLSLHPNPEYLPRARKLGEDTTEVLLDGGFTQEEIEFYRSTGAIQ